MTVRDIVMAAAGNAAQPLYVEDVFSTYLYTGNGSTQTITNNIDLSGEGGLVWIKNRSTGGISHALYNTVTGGYMSSNTTGSEGSGSGIISTSSTGFNVLVSGSTWNASSNNYASWTFRKAEKFFDVVTYTGNGASSRSISHNLGSAPGCIIIKCTSAGSTNWIVWHRAFTSGQNLELNTTGGGPYANAYFDPLPTSTVFTLSSVGSGGFVDNTNKSGSTYVAYLFAHDAGGFGDSGSESVIKCGTYTETGSALSVDLGFEPQWLMVKRSNGTGNWVIIDNMRALNMSTTNGAVLFPNLANAETNDPYWHPTATGFIADPYWGSGAQVIYIAIRRGPMKTPEAGTEVFSPNAVNAALDTKISTNFPIDLQLVKFQRDSATVANTAFDRLRGVSSNSTEVSRFLSTNATSAETTNTTSTTRGFDNTGFKVQDWYANTASIYWNFRRAPGFFDVVCYTGQATDLSVSHNLGVVPELMIVKSRSDSGGWSVYSSATGNTKMMLVNTTNAAFTESTWNNTTPTSSLFYVKAGFDANISGRTYVAYLFASVTGVSKVGSYTGNGSSQTINCGFTGGSRFVLIKRTDSTGDWVVFDSARGIVSGNDPYLRLNSTAAEVTDKDAVDTDSTGFVVNETTGPNINTNGASYIYLAIA